MKGRPRGKVKDMLKIYYYEAQDFNGMFVTDGTEAIEIKDFPQDGSLEMANVHDVSNLIGCETLSDIEYAMGTEIERIAFKPWDFDTLIEIKGVFDEYPDDGYHEYTEQEIKAAKKALDYAKFDQERVEEYLKDDTVTINIGRDGKTYAWVLTESENLVVEVESLEVFEERANEEFFNENFY